MVCGQYFTAFVTAQNSAKTTCLNRVAWTKHYKKIITIYALKLCNLEIVFIHVTEFTK